MAQAGTTYGRSPSTTWEWKKVKIRRPAGGQQARGPKGRRWYGRSRWDPREPLTLKVSYRGGEECWYEVHSRGSMGRFHGATALHDVMREIHQVD